MVVTASSAVEAAVAAKHYAPSSSSWRRETDFDGTRYGYYEYQCRNGTRIVVEEGFSSTGTRVWDTAVAMARLFEKGDIELPARVLELGAGTGLLGMAIAATAGSSVVSTDTREVVDVLKRTVDANQSPVTVREFDWNSTSPEEFEGYDLAVASDVLVCRQWAIPLARIFRAIVKGDAYVGTVKGRDGISHFVDALQDTFSIKTVPPDSFDPEYADPRIVVFHLRRRRLT